MKGAIERRLARFIGGRPLPLKPGVASVSITFDDVPMSACQEGAALLDRYGGRATYYVSGTFERTGTPGRFHTGDVLRQLQDQGHEIGCHGFEHLHYQRLSATQIDRDIAANQAYFADTGLPAATTFAYPYGDVSPAVKRICGAQYSVCRGITAGLNQRVMDTRLLRAVPLYDATWSARASQDMLEQVKAEGGLLVFFSHGVEQDPGVFDCSPGLLESTLKIACDLELSILPLSQAVSLVTDV